MSAEIRHIAIVSENYALLGEFYKAVFGLQGDESRPSTAASLTDGYLGLNINPRSPGRQAGIDHFGLLVEDVEEIAARLRDDWPSIQLLKRPSNRPFAGISTHDPCGNVFDLSQEGMENRRGIYAETNGTAHSVRVDHLVLRSVDAPKLARFYSEVYGLQPIASEDGDPNYYLTDGQVTLVLAPWDLSNYAGGGIERPALDHIGFAVEDIAAFEEDLERVVGRNPRLAPKAFKAGVEGDSRKLLLSRCRYGELQLCDPDGVLIDVIERSTNGASADSAPGRQR